MKRKIWMRSLWILLAGLSLFASAALPARANAAAESISGEFFIVWGDSFNGQPAPPIYRLAADDGRRFRVLLDDAVAEPLGGALALNRRHVKISGAAQISALGGDGVLRAQSVALDETGVSALISSVGTQRFVSIMCKFKDVFSEPKDLSYFTGMYGDAYPGLNHYWQEVSYNLLNINGSAAYGWYTLPKNRDYYITGSSLDFYGAAYDCAKAADADVDFSSFSGINLMFNNELDGYAWGGGEYMTLDGVTRYWAMTWEPPWGYGNIGTIAHEMGHAFGLPHSAYDPATVYDNVWDVMSDHWTTCYLGLWDATYQCLGQHTISYHKDLLGWIPPAEKVTVPYNSGGTFTLERLALPQTSAYKEIRIPIYGTSSFYTAEARRYAGYDSYLSGEAVILHKVTPSASIPARVIDLDTYNANSGDEGAMWRVGETFTDALHNIQIKVLSQTASGFTVQVANGNPLPQKFYKSAPASGVINQSLAPTLSWKTSAGATSYQYCYDLAENVCSTWHDAGAATSVTLSGLLKGKVYQWQVKALNEFGETLADGGAYWTFRTGEDPAAFSKTFPKDGSAHLLPQTALRWRASAGITPTNFYEYCYDATLNAACDSVWLPVGASLPTLYLPYNQTIEWQVRAVNDFGATYADSGAWNVFTTAALSQMTFFNVESQSGWLLESKETSNLARSKNSSGDLRVGDDALNRQYRARLSFDTAALPDKAKIQSVRLQIHLSAQTGDTSTLRGLYADVRRGYFASPALSLSDFSAPGAFIRTSRFAPTAADPSIYELRIPSAYWSSIHLSGATQFRLRFALDDDNDRRADFLSFLRSGAGAPALIVEYVE
ncbi:MAG: hypothetical protein Fur002_04060 [Anaerolineales bacterium]